MNYVQVGERKVEISDRPVIFIHEGNYLGCTLIDGNDLYDLCFDYDEIEDKGVTFFVNGATIHLESWKEKERRQYDEARRNDFDP